MTMNVATMLIHYLILFVGAHFLCDFPLQGQFLSDAKNPTNEAVGKKLWKIALPAHAWIQGLAVYLITGSIVLFVVEFLSHTYIDYVRCKGGFTFGQDQAVHLILKVIYALIIIRYPAIP